MQLMQIVSKHLNFALDNRISLYAGFRCARK